MAREVKTWEDGRDAGLNPAEIAARDNHQRKIYADQIARDNRQARGVRPVSTSSTTTSTRTKSSPHSALYGTMADEATAIQGEVTRLRDLIDQESNSLREFDALTDGGGYYKEDPDVGLMRALAEKMNNEPVGPYSNIAAQVAMVDDPNFAAVFDKAVNGRVNKAREHFSRMGTVSRMAQSGKDAQRQYRSRQRSQGDGRLKGLQGELKRYQNALLGMRETQNKRVYEGERDERRYANSRATAQIRGDKAETISRHTVQSSRLVERDKIKNHLASLTSFKGLIGAEISESLRAAKGYPPGTTYAQAIAKTKAELKHAEKSLKAIVDMPVEVTRIVVESGSIPSSTGGPGGVASILD